MNSTSRTSSGMAQDPLNFLQRSITESTKLSKRAKKHIAMAIRDLKRRGPYTWDEGIAHASRLHAYSESIHLREQMDKLRASDKAYKPVLWGLAKLSEIIVKFKSRKPTGHNGRGQQQGRVPPAARQPTAANTVPSAADADTATETPDAG